MRITRHCVDRYCERVRPALDPDRPDDRVVANREIRHLIRLEGYRTRTPPPWVAVASDPVNSDPEFWLVVDCLAFPMKQGELVSVYAKGGISDLARQHRNEDRQHRAASRRYKRTRRDSPA